MDAAHFAEKLVVIHQTARGHIQSYYCYVSVISPLVVLKNSLVWGEKQIYKLNLIL
jgi:hypothetical protein